ncbi:hypothetical protein JXB11_02905 [Candidatus Woesearchaeota archaeon]|nr:hypothetical protein [Candidatus Woesearchaeota archaeon]
MVFKRGRRVSSSAQVSMEYLIVISFVFMLIIPLTIYFVGQSQTATGEVNTAQLEQVSRKIVENAEKVYAFGEPTTFTLKVYIPDKVESVTIANNEIEFIINRDGSPSSVVEIFPMNVSGSLSTHQGIHKIRVQAINNSVAISEVS